MKRFLERLASLWRPHPGQEEFLLHPAKTKILACGRRWGKTDACAVQVLSALHESRRSRHLLLAPTLDQAKLLFDRVLELLKELVGLGGAGDAIEDEKLTPYPRFRFGRHRVSARSGHIGRSLRGNEATHIVIDEAAFVPVELITEVVSPMLATSDGSLTLISTPNGKNHFWRYFEMGRRGEHGFWSRSAPSSESPHVSRSFLTVQEELISERAFGVEYEARFLDSAGCVFRTEAVEQCVVPALGSLQGPYHIGVDFARRSDWTAVAVLGGSLQDSVLCEIVRIPRGSWASQLHAIRQVIARYPQPRVVCDATGIGDPLIEALNRDLENVRAEEFHFTAASKPALIDRLTSIFEHGWLKMEPHPELLRELAHFEVSQTDAGGARFGGASGYHDDLVIALALAAWKLPRTYRPRILMGTVRNFRGGD